MHEGVGRPYQWPDKSPLEVPASELPAITEAQVENFIEKVDAHRPLGGGGGGRGGGGGGSPDIIRDEKTGLVIDGREGWFRKARTDAWNAANRKNLPTPEEVAKKVWARAEREVDLSRGNRTYDWLLNNCKGDIRRIGSGEFKLAPGSVSGEDPHWKRNPRPVAEVRTDLKLKIEEIFDALPMIENDPVWVIQADASSGKTRSLISEVALSRAWNSAVNRRSESRRTVVLGRFSNAGDVGATSGAKTVRAAF